MDTTSIYRNIIEQIILRYARLRPSHGDIRLDEVFDETHDRYALMQVGWDRGRRVRGNLIYITLHHGKIHIEYDGMEHGIKSDLLAQGVSEEDIILASLPEMQAA
jgi:XisI protein